MFTNNGLRLSVHAGTEEELQESEEASGQGATEHAVRLLGGGARGLAQGQGHAQKLDQVMVCAQAWATGAV